MVDIEHLNREVPRRKFLKNCTVATASLFWLLGATPGFGSLVQKSSIRENLMDDIKGLQTRVDEYLKSFNRKDQLFTITKNKAALLVVDMQNFVCNPTDGRGLENMDQVIHQTNLMVDLCHKKKIPVIWLRQNFSHMGKDNDAGLYTLFHKSPLSRGMFDHGVDTEIFSGMHFLEESDHVVFKNRYSAFAPGSSSLAELLCRLNKNQLLVCGVATNVCVESTVRDAMQHGYQTVVLSDATTTFNDLIHQVSLINIKLFFGDVRTTEEIIEKFTNTVSNSLTENEKCKRS